MSDTSRYNETHTCIDKQVESGRTLVYDDKVSAILKAKELNTYYYPVYQYINGRLSTNGEYAVPK